MDDLHASAERWEWQTGGEHDARVTAAAVAVREHRGIIFVRSVRERLAVRADEPHIDVRAASRRDERQALHVTVNEHLPTVSHSVSIRDLRRPPGDDLDRRDVTCSRPPSANAKSISPSACCALRLKSEAHPASSSTAARAAAKGVSK